MGVGIVAFWLVMMGALVRIEYAERLSPLDEVPVERVMRKILSQPDPVRLNVYYQGQTVGVARADIIPLSTQTNPAMEITSRLAAYRIQGELTLNLAIGDFPIKLRVNSESLVSRQLELERMSLRGAFNETRFSVRAETVDDKMAVTYDIGDGRGSRQLTYDQNMGIGLAQSLGLPASILPRTTAGSSAPGHTKAYFGRFSVAGTMQRAYLIETRLNEALWAKFWVDEGGQVLQAETSAGVVLRSDILEEEIIRREKEQEP